MLYKTTHNHYSLTFVSLNCSNTGLVSFLPSVSLYPITLSNSDKLTSITLKLKILLGSLVWPPTPFTTTHCFTLPNHFHQFGIYKTYHGPHLVWVFKMTVLGMCVSLGVILYAWNITQVWGEQDISRIGGHQGLRAERSLGQIKKSPLALILHQWRLITLDHSANILRMG